MSLVGKKAPKFQGKAILQGKTIDEVSLEDYLGKYVVFFFYPLDFTFVCPTELHAFQDKLEEFHKRGAEVVGCSIDSVFSHYAWLQVPKHKGGVQGITYPLVSDIHKKIAQDYGVLNEEEGVAFRGLFLIDPEGIIRHVLINDLPLGRSVEEAIRMLDALIFHEKNGEVCPANWREGGKGMRPNNEGLVSYFSQG